jgi:hypothetical protein
MREKKKDNTVMFVQNVVDDYQEQYCQDQDLIQERIFLV